MGIRGSVIDVQTDCWRIEHLYIPRDISLLHFQHCRNVRTRSVNVNAPGLGSISVIPRLPEVVRYLKTVGISLAVESICQSLWRGLPSIIPPSEA